VFPEPRPEPPAVAGPPAPELVPALALTALVPPKSAFELPALPPALAPPLLDPAVELPGKELGVPQPVIPATNVNELTRTTLIVREFFMCRCDVRLGDSLFDPTR